MRFPRDLCLPIIAMSLVVITSNILVQFLLVNWLTWGAITYPLAFLTTDLTNRFYGKNAARMVVLFGFIVGIFCSFIGTQIYGEFGPLVTFRVAIGSALAFLTAQLLDVSIFHRFRNANWWKAPLISSFLGSSIDTIFFFFIAFSATCIFLDPLNDISWALEKTPVIGLFGVAPLWVSLALADFLVKISLISLSLIPFRILIMPRRVRAKIL